MRALPGIVGVVLVIGLVGEGAGHLGHPVVPQPAKAEIGLPGPVLDLPTDGALDRIWQYFSTDGFYKIPVGESTFDIPAIDDLRGGMNGFPDRASVEKLRYYGIKTVVLHTVIPPGLPPEQGWVIAEPPDPAAAAKKPIAGLGITRAAGRLGRDLRDRPRAERAARIRLMLTKKRLALAAILLVGVANATMIQSFSWNQTSHYDLTRALNQDKTTIDAYAANTGDKVEYKGHTYSARAPGLALFVLPFYNALNLVGRRIVDGRACGAAGSPGRRDDLPDRPVGQRAARAAAAGARVARRRALPARLRRRDGGRYSAWARSCCRSRRCCSATCSPRSSASPPSG